VHQALIMSTAQRYFDEIAVGQSITMLSKGPMTTMHIMRWSAAIENWHRIHYDRDFATGHEGLPDILVNGSWKQHVLVQCLKDWAGLGGWLWKIKFQFRDKDLPGDTLVAGGTVTGTSRRGGMGIVECDIYLENQRGVRSTTGEAHVALPLRAGAPLPYPFVAPPPADV
jgi:acyl dehydratase